MAHQPAAAESGAVVGLKLLLPLLFLCASLPALAEETRTVVDDAGRRVEVPLRIERIVSLAPNATEMVFALELGERLVGVTNQCDYPPAAQAKPKVGDVINPSLERIIALKPDLVLGSTAGNRRETVEALERAGLPLYGIHAPSLPEIFSSMRRLAELLEAPAGLERAARLEARLAALKEQVSSAPRPRVLFVIWLEPLVTAGADTFLSDLLAYAGAESVTAGLTEHWPRLSLETLVESDPDYLVFAYSHSLEARFRELAARPPWQTLRAVREKRVVWLDEAALRPGPRIVDVVEELARALHPETFSRKEAAQK
ncbi:MAG: ABC transporter substrate-binding protein [Acidobacteria bacterium]|nr:ABC transporter substrate-binding protein [Acidobacteriota bacterium]